MKNIIFLFFFFINFNFIYSQNNNIIIGNNDKIYVNNKDSFKTIVGKPAEISQGTIRFNADSIYINEKEPDKYIEAFGNVYINESDSVITTSSYLKYFTNKKTALLRNNVTIKSKSNGVFTSNEVEYDLNTHFAVYKNYGKIVSKGTTLTSKYGQYYTNTNDALFTNKVEMNSPDYNITNDTLYYNTKSEIANFVSYTKVYNRKKNQTIVTTRGFYNMKQNIAKFDERSKIVDSERTIEADIMDFDDHNKKYILQGKASIIEKNRKIYADYININDANKIYDLQGNAKINDDKRNAKAQIINIDEYNKKYHLQGEAFIYDKEKKETYKGEKIDLDGKNEIYHIEGNGLYSNEKEGFVITGNYLDGDGKQGKSLATGKPVAIIKQENDSIYIAADTLYSGRIIKNKKIKTDSITSKINVNYSNKNSSTDTTRYFEGFHHVRIFNDSVQAICDSMYYSEADSVFRLYQNPIVWNKQNQITGDTMYMFSKNKKIDKVEVFEKGFILNTVIENKFYNQIKANKITAYFLNGEIDSLYCKGSSEIIFYIQDENKGFVGVDKSSADIIIAYFKNKEIYKLKWINKYDASTIPMKQALIEPLKLRGFNILENKRPKSKFELFF